jgi:hypothetical protein
MWSEGAYSQKTEVLQQYCWDRGFDGENKNKNRTDDLAAIAVEHELPQHQNQQQLNVIHSHNNNNNNSRPVLLTDILHWLSITAVYSSATLNPPSNPIATLFTCTIYGAVDSSIQVEQIKK